MYGTVVFSNESVFIMAQMMIEKRDAGKLKSAQYNAAIVVNAIEDVKIIEDGKQRLKPVESGSKKRCCLFYKNSNFYSRGGLL